mmetsp:Transcript_57421/g.184468  ORF Transcript_57421/g.184468 Transcript_57421/m.184468 type:complete len:765 (-) Transcript_57421:277-2571(-)
MLVSGDSVYEGLVVEDDMQRPAPEAGPWSTTASRRYGAAALLLLLSALMTLSVLRVTGHPETQMLEAGATPQELYHLHEENMSTPSPDILKTEKHDCKVGSDEWRTNWSEPKKEWCCLKVKKGCKKDEPCLGFDECPEYPLPYKHGEWPQKYDFSTGGLFPEHFVWGFGTAAYQIEGAFREDGRGATIWDTFTGADTTDMPGANCSYCCKEPPCKPNAAMHEVAHGATGNVACDHYHTFEADVQFMKSMGLKHYRFSIAWSRIYPTGRKADGVNKKGVAWYNGLLDALARAGITPWVTLYHWDLPQGLLDPPARQGWWSVDPDTGKPNAAILEDWLAYVDTCFQEFGDRVAHWLTFNEPWCSTMLASGWGKAPSIEEYSNMTKWPFVAGHNILIAHAKAVELYRKKYKPTQKGQIGMTNNMDWREPKSESSEDIAAAERIVQFQIGWYAHPVYTGDYPPVMRRLYGDRLPEFTEEEKKLLKGSVDFFGMNQYGGAFASYAPDEPGADLSYSKSSTEGFKHGQSSWLTALGFGLSKILHWIDRTYDHPPIYVFEAGWSLGADNVSAAVHDLDRATYYANRSMEMLKTMDEGVDLRGFFAWSLMDNFEWEWGYIERFGASWSEFHFGQDPRAPAGPAGKPTAGRQWRRRKDSSCWLEEVWYTRRVQAPDAIRCVNSSVFAGNFTNPELPHSVYTIALGQDGVAGTISGSDPVKDSTWGEVPALLSGGTIVANFTKGKESFVGYWNRKTNTIHWQDGSLWKAGAARS